MLNDNDFLRFSRQIALPEVGEEKQKSLAEKSILIVGVGGLGCHVAEILVRSGIRQLTLIDDDVVCVSNLPRQSLFTSEDVGRLKSERAKARLETIDAALRCRIVTRQANNALLRLEVPLVDMVIDCTDNRETRLAINQACLNAAVPLISGACIEWQGLQMQFPFHHQTTGCYACLFPTEKETPQNCQSASISAPLVGMVAARQAMVALKIGWKMPISWQTLWHYDAKKDRTQNIQWQADPYCSVCGK